MSFTTSCLHCGKTYEAKRSTSKYCSAKCRVAHNRELPNRVNIPVEMIKIMESLQHLQRLSDKQLLEQWSTMSQVINPLEQLVERYRNAGERRFNGEL